MRVFFDTNVLAYQFDDDQAGKQRRARELFVAHAADAVVSTQVLIELHAVLTRKLGRSRGDARAVLRALDVDVMDADRQLVLAAADTALAHDLSIFDAMILEAAARAGCEQLWTEDLSQGSRLRGVLIVNPFEA
ncbi:MAG: PIN domain-containing protein [Microbacterium sp.]